MSKVRLTGSSSGYAEITAPAVAGNNTVTLPSSNGSANQLLKNGVTPGALEYSTVSIGSTGELDKITAINGGPLAGFRNRIINGNFDFWQRGTSFTGAEYGADRWVHGRVGTTHTATRQGFPVGQTDVPGNSAYYCRTVVSSVAGAGNYAELEQRIEDVRTFAGQQVTISFWARADATKNIAINIVQNFGTGGSPSANVGISGTKVSIGTTFQKVTVTATLPSISGKTLGTDNNSLLQLLIWFDAGSTWNGDTDSLGQQSGTFDIAQVQIEPGAVATPFEQRPIGTELALCQRYFNRIVTGPTGSAVTATDCHLTFPAGVPMRTDPTFSLSAPAKVDWPNNSNFTQSSASISASFGTSNCAYNFLMGNFTGLTVHSRLVLRADGGAVSLSAEL